jgi:SAM-dependent methyltransferase
MVYSTEQTKAYSEAVASGTYEREKGLRKKYDNVRLFWEDELTRWFIRPGISRLLNTRKNENRKLRILDLGCGSGDGYELLMEMFKENPDYSDKFPYVIKETDLEQYIGIDFNRDLLKQNEKRWVNNTGMKFIWGDLSKGLPVKDSEDAFDIYFSSFGTYSHFTEEQTIKILTDITEHAENGSIVICDWLGRYSYEWQTLWDFTLNKEKWMDYLISYIYPEEERKKKEISILALRLLAEEEIKRIVRGASEKTGIEIRIKGIFDRSIFIGRHMDTKDYNPHLKCLRQAVNSLFEKNIQTDLNKLKIEYNISGLDKNLDGFFKSFSFCWNSVVNTAENLLKNRYSENEYNGSDLKEPFKTVLKEELANLKNAINGAELFVSSNKRANILEPQIACILRNLEYRLQQGIGCGHGLILTAEIIK